MHRLVSRRIAVPSLLQRICGHGSAVPQRQTLLFLCARRLFSSPSSSSSGDLPSASPVILEYSKLGFEDYSAQIEAAYGEKGLGLLLVKGIPQYAEARKRLLPLIHKFANLPPEVRKKMECPDSNFGVGWVHGKEKLGATGEPDLLKANYKANPQYNIPTDDHQLRKKYPDYCHPNIWPKEDLPEFEHAFMALGSLVVSVGVKIAALCDVFVKSKIPSWQLEDARSLKNTILHSRTCKARALHYYPPTAQTSQEWCGWHNDHGSLTGLTSSMYMEEDGKEVSNPDPRSGLVIAPRNTSSYPPQVKVTIPADYLAFQIGECSQIVSGGHLKATPHMVRSPANEAAVTRKVSRSTFAVFMQPALLQPLSMPKESLPNAIDSNAFVPPLGSRYAPTQDFITFTKQTFAKYYEFQRQQQ